MSIDWTTLKLVWCDHCEKPAYIDRFLKTYLCFSCLGRTELV